MTTEQHDAHVVEYTWHWAMVNEPWLDEPYYSPAIAEMYAENELHQRELEQQQIAEYESSYATEDIQF